MKSLRTTGLALLALLAVILAVAYLAVPSLGRHLLAQTLSEALQQPVRVEALALNPFKLEAKISGFALGGTQTEAPWFTFDDLTVDLAARSVVYRAPVLDALRLTRPHLSLARLRDGRYNISPLIEFLQSKPDTKQGPARFALFNIELIGGTVDFDDQLVSERHRLSDIEIGLPFISTLPEDHEVHVEPHLSALFNGKPIRSGASSQPLIEATPTSLHLELSQVDLPRYMAYLPGQWGARLVHGSLSSALDLHFSRDNRVDSLELSGSIDLRSLQLVESAGASLTGFDHLVIDIAHIRWPAREVAIRRIELTRPTIDVRRGADGQINLAQLGRFQAARAAARDALAQTANTTYDDSHSPPAAAASDKSLGQSTTTPATASSSAMAAEPAMKLTIDDIQVHGAQVQVNDLATNPAFRLRIDPLELHIEKASFPQQEPATRITLRAKSANGLELKLATELAWSAVPALKGSIALTTVHPADFATYFRDQVPFDLSQQTRLDLSSNFDLALDRAPSGILSQLHAQASDASLLLSESARQPIPIGQITIDDAQIDLNHHRLDVGRIAAADAQLIFTRAADGSMRLGAPPPSDGNATTRAGDAVDGSTSARPRGDAPRGSASTPPPGDAAAGGAPPKQSDGPEWSWQIAALTLDRYDLRWNDETTVPAVALHAAPLALNLKNVSNKTGNLAQVSLALGLNSRGLVSVQGDFGFNPMAGTLTYRAEKIDLTALQGYLARVTRLGLSHGELASNGTVRLLRDSEGSLAPGFSGDLALSDIACTAPGSQTELLNWAMLRVKDIDFASAPRHVAIGSVELTDFAARIELDSQGKLNLQALAGAPASAEDAHPVIAPASTEASVPVTTGSPSVTPPAVTIGHIAFSGGQVDFSDQFIKPSYRAHLNEVSGEIGTITEQLAGDVQLHARLDDSAPVELTGKINPIARPIELDLQARATDIQLPALTPYAGRYVGYGIEKGSLSVDLSYHIADGRLAARNKLRLDQLTFGNRVDSPDAIKLPILLAVSLLKDKNGLIDIDLPISGTLNDPKFSVGDIILKTLVQLLERAVTSPFRLLASAFGNSAEELGYVEFAPGQSELDPAAIERLTSLARALNERKGLSLEIAGRADPNSDGVAAPGKAASGRSAMSNALATFATLTSALISAPPAASATVQAPEPLSPDALRALANRRAAAARAWLTGPGAIDPNRVFIVAPVLNAVGITDQGKPNRVDFSLR